MPFSVAEQAEFRAKLSQLVQSLEQALADSAEAARPVELDQPTVGRVSRIDAIQQQQMLEATRRAMQSRLQLSRGALRRLEEDEFGDCQACGENIGEARLRARPESLYCIECQTAREAR